MPPNSSVTSNSKFSVFPMPGRDEHCAVCHDVDFVAVNLAHGVLIAFFWFHVMTFHGTVYGLGDDQ